MTGFPLAQIICYVSLLTFVASTMRKIVRCATMPMHLRWELYPVPHHAGRPSGGSYLEDLDGAAKYGNRNPMESLRYMAREVFFFAQCYHHNRSLWYFTYPFHVGLFLLTAWCVLVLVGAIVLLNGGTVSGSSNAIGKTIYYLTLSIGGSGLLLGITGSIGLILKRATDRNLKDYTAPVDFFNIGLILAVLVGGLWTWLLSDPAFHMARDHLGNLLTFTPFKAMDPLMSVSIVLSSLFLAYMPFTHMSHAFTKFFIYHRIRWDDEPMVRGGLAEKQSRLLLDRRVSWSSPHVQGRRWIELISKSRTEE